MNPEFEVEPLQGSPAVPGSAQSPFADSGKQQASNVEKVVKAQVFFILSTLRHDQYETKVKQLESLVSQNGPEIYLHLVRRLITANAPRIFDSQGQAENSALLRLLHEQIHTLSSAPSNALQFGEAITGSDTEFFRKFDLVAFIRFFHLDPSRNIILATSPSLRKDPTLVNQINSIIDENFAGFLEDLSSNEALSNRDELNLLSQGLPSNHRQSLHNELMKKDEVLSQHVYNGSGARLVSILERTFYADIHSSAQLQELLKMNLPTNFKPSDADIAQLVVYVVTNYDLEKWDGRMLGEALSVMYKVDWPAIVQNLDQPNFVVEDHRAFDVLLDILSVGSEISDTKFSLDFVLRRWTHTNAQASLLFHITDPNQKRINVTHLGERRILSIDDFAEAPPTMTALATVLEGRIWNSFDLVVTLIDLFIYGASEDISMILERALKATSELIFLGVIQQAPPYHAMQEMIISRCIQSFFQGHPGGSLVFYRLWRLQPNTMINAFRDLWAADSNCVINIFNIARDLGILGPFYEVEPVTFALDIATTAASRQELILSNWLKQKFENVGDQEGKVGLVHSCLEFLSGKSSAEATLNSGGAATTASIRVDVVAEFLQFLMDSNLISDMDETLKSVQVACLQVYPRLFGLGHGKDSIVVQNSGDKSFAADVEKQIERDYQRLYEHSLSITEVVMHLQKLKGSDDRRDLDVFICTLHSLFDEYRFFPDYPLNALAVTAVLFGSLIQYGLLSSIPLSVALSYVYEALCEPPESNMFRFGIQALVQFQQRLPQYPEYCQMVIDIPHLALTHPDVLEVLKESFKRKPVNQEDNTNPESIVEHMELPFTSLSVDPLPNEIGFYNEPNEAVQDKILFAINNMSQSNFNAKLSEVKGILKAPHFNWFANYLVLKRASREPNFHQLYSRFLESMQDNDLIRHVLRETIANVMSYLNSEKTKLSTVERSVLKNLGSWLGIITLRRNKAIKHKNIAFKELLIEGYDSNRLLVVLPFVCKVLEQAKDSKVFRPPNPWLMGILKLLVELYQDAEMKLNLKFEIEVLCKNLDLDINNMEPSDILARRAHKSEQLLEDSRVDQVIEEQGFNAPAGEIETATEDLAHQALVELANNVDLRAAMSYQINQANLRKLVLIALDQSLREVVVPVVDRAVAIGVIAARELVLKDFATEGSERNLRRAAHATARSLSSSLGLITCREPLRMSLHSNLRSLMTEAGFDDQQMSVQLIEDIANDNHDLATSVAEKAAAEKAIMEIDNALTSAYLARRRHEETKGGQPFVDPSQTTTFNVPELLDLHPQGLSNEQLSVYESFDRVPKAISQLTNAFGKLGEDRVATEPQANGRSYLTPELDYSQPAKTVDGSHNTQNDPERIIAALNNVFSSAKACPYDSIQQITPDDDLQLALDTFSAILADVHNAAKDDALIACAERSVEVVFADADRLLLLELAVAILDRLRSMNNNVAQFLSSYLLYTEDAGKLKPSAYAHLVRTGIVSLSELDIQFAKSIWMKKTEFIPFCVAFIRKTVLGSHPDALLTDFSNTLSALESVLRDPSPAISESVLQDLESLLSSLKPKSTNAQALARSLSNEEGAMREQLGYIFAEWIRLTQQTLPNSKPEAAFILQLENMYITKDDQLWCLFLRVALELSLDSYSKYASSNQNPTESQLYMPIDACSKLVFATVLYQSRHDLNISEQSCVNILERSLSLVVLFLAHEHETRGSSFDQKPFFRFFSSLLWEIASGQSFLEPVEVQRIQGVLAETFQTLQPSVFPSFSFAWLSLISHRKFMPALLETQYGPEQMLKLIIVLFEFLQDLLNNQETQDLIPARLILKGVVRTILVITQNFPHFIMENFMVLVLAIPEKCTQLRNIILSTSPTDIEPPPNPFHDHTRFDDIATCQNDPLVRINFNETLGSLKGTIDESLGQGGTNTSEVAAKLGEFKVFAVDLMNALILYVGLQALEQNKARRSIHAFQYEPEQPSAIFVISLAQQLDVRGRFFLINAVVNQLRFPNSHTAWFMQLFLDLWRRPGSNDVSLQEQLTRVILERLIPHRPHPWGLLMTFHELLRDASYRFWTRPFLAENRQISKVFDSIQEHMMIRDQRRTSVSQQGPYDMPE